MENLLNYEAASKHYLVTLYNKGIIINIYYTYYALAKNNLMSLIIIFKFYSE